MKISYIIFLSFFLILLLFSITTFINYRQSELVNTNSEEFARSSIVIRHSNRFQRNFLNMVSGLRGYLLTNESFFIQTYDSAIIENENILNELGQLVRQGSEQRILLDEIHELHTYWVTEFAMPLLEAKKLADLSDSGKVTFNKMYREKILNGVDKGVQRSLQQKFSQFSNVEYGFRDTQKEALEKTVDNTRSISFSLTAISVVAGICIAMFIAGYISSRIVKMVKMANDIADGNYNVAMPENGRGELNQLAHALNNMAQILHTNISLLKRQRDELDQFAHIASHDIKTPLRGIDNVVTWIEEDHSFDLPPKVREYLALIKGRIVRAENLLKGILDYARIGKESRELEIVDLNEMLNEIVEYVPKRPGIDLRIQPGLPIIRAERVPLLQVFTNLISNAFKYHNKPDGYVKVYYRSNGLYYEFFVEDNGPGIEKNYHDKIFLIFQTLESRDSFESTGIGLAIIKKILDDRDLKIKVTSEPGVGSTFSFTWPKNENVNATSNQYSFG
jgi:signal transduction histidine kinase